MVDPDLKILIEMAASQKFDYTKMKAQDIRNLMDEYANSMNTQKIDIKEVNDLNIELSGRTLKARFYNDSDSEKMILYFHGGGFVFGNIETHDSLCRLIAKTSKLKVISIDYRLAPENKFPDAVNDAHDSFMYLYNNSDAFGINKNLIAVSGDSAGGNLIVSMCLMARDKGEALPALEILFYPSLAPDNFSKSFEEYSENYFLTGNDIMWFASQYLKSMDDMINPYFSPLVVDDFSGLPPAIVVTGEYDPLRDPAETYVKKLRKSNVNAVGIRASGMIHGFATDFEISYAAKNIVKMVYSIVPDMIQEKK